MAASRPRTLYLRAKSPDAYRLRVWVGNGDGLVAVDKRTLSSSAKDRTPIPRSLAHSLVTMLTEPSRPITVCLCLQ
jgi:hypothetical protein